MNAELQAGVHQEVCVGGKVLVGEEEVLRAEENAPHPTGTPLAAQ